MRPVVKLTWTVPPLVFTSSRPLFVAGRAGRVKEVAAGGRCQAGKAKGGGGGARVGPGNPGVGVATGDRGGGGVSSRSHSGEG